MAGSLGIIHEVLRNKDGKEILRYIHPEPVDLGKKRNIDTLNFMGVYRLYCKIHPLSLYRFSYDKFIEGNNLEYEIYEIRNPCMMNNDVFYNTIEELCNDPKYWTSDDKSLIGKTFDERKRICESLVSYICHRVSKQLELIESADIIGDWMYVSYRTNVCSDYIRKFKSGDKVKCGDSIVTITDLGPDDSIPYSCLGWSERYCIVSPDELYSDWIPESQLESI